MFRKFRGMNKSFHPKGIDFQFHEAGIENTFQISQGSLVQDKLNKSNRNVMSAEQVLGQVSQTYTFQPK